MKEYKAGRESSILTYILTGQKTTEIRLNRGKFAKFQPGDHIRIREDIYENGAIKRSVPDRAVSEIIQVNHYRTFRELFEAEGKTRSILYVKPINEAIKECRKFYTEEQEKQYGVLAIRFQIIKKPGGPI